MSIRVVIHRRARRDMEDYLDYLIDNAPVTVSNWFEDLQSHVLGLASTASMWAAAAENRKCSKDLRESHFGSNPNVFRVLFYIQGDQLHVIRVLRAQHRFLTKKEIKEAINGVEAAEEDE